MRAGRLLVALLLASPAAYAASGVYFTKTTPAANRCDANAEDGRGAIVYDSGSNDGIYVCQYPGGAAGWTRTVGGSTTPAADSILESMLKAVDAGIDEECLTYETTTGDFEWQTCGTGGANSFETINAPAGTDPVADAANDTLALTCAAPLTCTGDATADSIAFGWAADDISFSGVTGGDGAELNLQTSLGPTATLVVTDGVDDSRISITPTTITLDGAIFGATASRCARFDGTGNLVSASGDCSSGDTTTPAADAVTEAMLKAVDAASDEECLTYETTTGDFEWQACGGGSVNSFETINASSGTDPVADSSTDTLALTCTSPMTCTGDSSTDTVTIAIDVPYSCEMRRDAAQNISNGTPTKIAFDAEGWDVGAFCDITTNDRADIARTGKYRVSVAGGFDNFDAADPMFFWVYVDGGIVARSDFDRGTGTNVTLIGSASFELSLTTGQYVEFYVQQTEGAAQDSLTSTEGRLRMTVTEIR